MRDKIKWIILGILALIAIVFGCLYFIPKTTPIDITLSAVKYESRQADANELGIVQIHIHGNLMEYLLRPDELDLKIDDFDHLYDIHPWQSPEADGTYPNFKVDLDGEGYQYGVMLQASSTVTGEGSAIINVVFRNDFKKWELFINDHVLTDESVKDDPSLNLAYRATLE